MPLQNTNCDFITQIFMFFAKSNGQVSISQTSFAQIFCTKVTFNVQLFWPYSYMFVHVWANKHKNNVGEIDTWQTREMHGFDAFVHVTTNVTTNLNY